MGWVTRTNLKGPAGTFQSVTAETLAPGSAATATIGGTLEERSVVFGIPEGVQGLPGVNAVPADEAVAGYVSTTGTSATKTALLEREPYVNVRDYGTVGDGVADDGAAVQLAFDAVADGGTVVFPDGTYLVSNSPHIDGTDVTVNFSGHAFLKPTAGIGVRINGIRVTLNAPKVRIEDGAATCGIWVGSASGSFATHAKIRDPLVIAMGNINGTVDGITVDNNSYWCEITHPSFRKDSGTFTGTFRRLISILGQSNASVVWGGNFASADTGVFIQDSNSTVVIGSAFESVTTGVELAGTTIGAAGTRVIGTRHETGTNCILISTTVTNNNAPIFFSGISRIGSVANLVVNPNGVAYAITSGSEFTLMGNGFGDSFNAAINIVTYSSQTKSPFSIKNAAGVRSLELDRNGNIIISSVSGAWPTAADEVGVLRHYAGVTQLGTVYPSSTGGAVHIGVGNGSGAFSPVIIAVGTSVTPGNDGFINLGTATARWNNGFFKGYVKVGTTTTAARPAAGTAGAGAHMFDTSLGKPIWSNGTAWVDATGATA